VRQAASDGPRAQMRRRAADLERAAGVAGLPEQGRLQRPRAVGLVVEGEMLEVLEVAVKREGRQLARPDVERARVGSRGTHEIKDDFVARLSARRLADIVAAAVAAAWRWIGSPWRKGGVPHQRRWWTRRERESRRWRVATDARRRARHRVGWRWRVATAGETGGVLMGVESGLGQGRASGMLNGRAGAGAEGGSSPRAERVDESTRRHGQSGEGGDCAAGPAAGDRLGSVPAARRQDRLDLLQTATLLLAREALAFSSLLTPLSC
jgi:hypothetical protein